MSGKVNKRPLRALSAHEKLDAIRRVHDGESKASVARDIGVPESTLRGWCKNEDKISYLSRQSSPETDESLDRSIHNNNKKQKLDESFTQPFNLSLKTHNSFAPTSTEAIDVKPRAPLNLQNTNTIPTESTPKSTNHLTERERNRAELARLSIELGLNRPEMFMPNVNNSSLLSDLTTNISLITQWNALLTQHQQMKALQGNQGNRSSKMTTSADVTSPINTSNSLLTTVDQEKNSSLPKDVQSAHESVWYWLRSQQMLNLNNSVPTSTPLINQQHSPVNGVSAQTTTTAPSSSTPLENGVHSDQSSWFWKWYKQFSYQEQDVNKPILYQQLTKDSIPKNYNTSTAFTADQQNAENLSLKDEKQKLNGTKARSVLDNILFNDNVDLSVENNHSKEDEDVLSQSEALVHGEKFLTWLESYSDPSVTAVQIMQFRSLLNNVKSGADRKNCDLQNKTKVKRK